MQADGIKGERGHGFEHMIDSMIERPGGRQGAGTGSLSSAWVMYLCLPMRPDWNGVNIIQRNYSTGGYFICEGEGVGE